MVHEKFKPGTEDDLRKYRRQMVSSILLMQRLCRPLLAELRRREPFEECIRLHPQSQEARALQPVLPREQELDGADMGMYFGITSM